MTDLHSPAPNLLLIALGCLEEAIDGPFDPKVSRAIDALVNVSEEGWT